MPISPAYRPDPAFARFSSGAPYHDAVKAAEFPQAILRYRNQRWAERVGLGALSDDDWIEHFGKFRPLPDNLAEPLALRYHGHQFRSYNPDIGDGRGFLFAQLRDAQGRLLDLGTKGSGQTPYSRLGDGRLTLKGGVREILATEMLEALGVYTSKTFSLIETGEALARNDEPSPTRSSVLVRLSHSHVRFGTFQRLAFEQNAEAIAALVDYCVKEFDPDLAELEGSTKAVRFFERAVSRTARLVAQWMAAGFVHGVLNSDNMNVTGESFDYGPWRFTPTADPSFTAAYFDQSGLYAFGRQSESAAWNLARFGGALTLVCDERALNAAFQGFPAAFEVAMAEAFFRRLGLKRTGADDFALVVTLLRWMEATRAPYERVFFDWFCGRASENRAAASPLAGRYDTEDFAPVRAALLAREPDDAGRLAHPYFTRPEPSTMLIDKVEAIWEAIAENDDWSRLEAKLGDVAAMREAYAFNASTYATCAA
ncbi:MAG: YdiU family protein [Parvularculaceae bacterium]